MPPISRTPILQIATLLFLAIGIARSGYFILHQPVLGYGNSYDMVRVQSCFNLWPTIPTSLGAHYEMPSPSYYTRDDLPFWQCYPSSGLAFFWIVQQIQHLVSDNDQLDIRYFGAVHGAALLACVSFLLWLWRDSLPIQLAFALSYALLLTDPLNLLYANTLYLEFAALIFAVLSFGVTLKALTVPQLSMRLVSLLAFSLIMLGLAKMQYEFSGLLLALLLMAARLTARRALRPLHAGFLLAAGLLPLLFFQAYPVIYKEAIHAFSSRNMANRTNTFLGLFLGSASDPVTMTAHLGLPPHCVPHAGRLWFDPELQKNHPCPEIKEASRLRLITALLIDPAMTQRILYTTFSRARHFVNPKFGHIAGTMMGHIPSAKAGPYFSFGSIIAPLSQTHYFWLLAGSALMSVIALRWIAHPLPFTITALGASGFLMPAASIFGDGAIDALKQCHLLYNALFPLLILSIIWLLQAVRHRRFTP